MRSSTHSSITTKTRSRSSSSSRATQKMSIFANTTLRELGELLSGAESVLLFSHINPDPDAIGSSTALCLALRQQGVRSFVVLDEPLPGYMRFLERDLEAGCSDGAEGSCSAGAQGGSPLTLDQDIIPEPDISLCIDCSEDSRLLGREESYYRGKVTVAIDHHQVKECSRDYYYVDSGTAACSQIVYQLMKEMGWPLDHRIAELLYAGLDGDTGCFMHSNTTSEVFRMAADLIEYNVDINTINVNLYQSKELAEVLIEARILLQMELIAGGRALIGKVTPKDLEACNATVEDTNQVIDAMRKVVGVEIAALLKQDGPKVRATMRAKTDCDVQRIASANGGGGHIKAAGFSSFDPIDQVYDKLKGEITEEIERVLGPADEHILGSAAEEEPEDDR